MTLIRATGMFFVCSFRRCLLEYWPGRQTEVHSDAVFQFPKDTIPYNLYCNEARRVYESFVAVCARVSTALRSVTIEYRFSFSQDDLDRIALHCPSVEEIKFEYWSEI